MAAESRQIAVYADWLGLAAPKRYGWLDARPAEDHEIFEFEFDKTALSDPNLSAIPLDPRIGPFEGGQYPEQGRRNFGVFLDSSPDRWGRMLMERRLERDQRQGKADPTAVLRESDYMLGVHDAFRVGALRYRPDDESAFQASAGKNAAPPFVQLRGLEEASRALENDNADPQQIDESLRILIAPGGSLGGARPKASVQDPKGGLWIAKFPSRRDEHDVGAWELVVNVLAKGCGIRVPESRAQRFASEHRTFLTRRFDRPKDEGRLHFASAMTLTGHDDGEDHGAGVSYLEICDVLMRIGVAINEDLHELWSRIVFNMCVSNADDHLRNHGFLLEPGRGWRLAPSYDMNPDPAANGLKLNVSEADNAQELDLALSVAPIFRIKHDEAKARVQAIIDTVRQWHTIANAASLPKREQDRMERAFRLTA